MKNCQYIVLGLIMSISFLSKSFTQTPELMFPSKREISAFAFSSDDKMMISFGEKELRIWKTEGPYLIKTLPLPDDKDYSNSTHLYFSPDNKKLIYNNNGQIRILNLQTLEWDKVVWKIEAPSYSILSRDGNFLYYIMSEGNDDPNLYKLNLATGKLVKFLSFKQAKRDNGDDINYDAKLSLNADESLCLFSDSYNCSVLFDLKSNKIIKQFKESQIPLFINEAGNVIASTYINGKNKVDEIEPRTMKIVRSKTFAMKTDDKPEYNYNTLKHNGSNKIMYETDHQFYIVNTIDFTVSKRLQVKCNMDGCTSGSKCALSPSGKFAFWFEDMTAFRLDDLKKPYRFGIASYRPFMLSDLSRGDTLKLLAGNQIVSFEAKGLSFTQLPKGLFFDELSNYRYLPSQKRLFITGVPFNNIDETRLPYVYDLKNDTSQIEQLLLSKDINYEINAMREFDSLNSIVLLFDDRFFIVDTRTLRVKQQVIYGGEYFFSRNTRQQQNDDRVCSLSADKTKLIVVLNRSKNDLNQNTLACYDLINKRQIWKYESEEKLSNPVYYENDKMVRFFTDNEICKTLDAQTGKTISSKSLTPKTDHKSQFSPTQKYVLNKIMDNEFFVKTDNYEVYEVASKKLMLSLPKPRVGYRGAIFMSNDRYLLTQEENDIKLWDIAKGKLIAQIMIFPNNNWIVLTPDGRFDGSPDGLKTLYYVKGQDGIPLEQLYEGFYTPGLSKQVLAGTVSDTKRDMKNITSPPSVKLTYEPSKTYKELLLEGQTMEVDKSLVQIVAEATCNEGVVEEIRLYHNGKLVGNATRNLVVDDEKSKTEKKVFDIELIEGENRLKVVAINSQRTESKPDEIIFIYKSKTPSVSTGNLDNITLHLLVVGINNYKNPKHNLNYATADAVSFKEAIEKGSTSIFSKTNIVFLGDAQATKEGISTALDKIKAAAKPKDVFIFYYAGHGVMNEKKDFYLVPYDVIQMYGQDDALAQKGLSANELQQFSRDIKAQKQLFILDACQSAGALETLGAARGAAEEKAIAQLARATGTHWLTASGSEQSAAEFPQLGHGTFTYVLLEALSGKADSGGDKKITVKELDAYLQEQVPEMTAKYRGTPQYPSSYGYGNDFPIGVVKQ
jgi:WD40 repeat protein